MGGRKSVFSIIVFLIAAAALLDGLFVFEMARKNLTDSVSEARENKEKFYVARNVEETFWQTLAQTADACATCDGETLQAMTSANVLAWESFWFGQEGLVFFGAVPAAATRFPENSRAIGSVRALATPQGDAKLCTFIVERGGFFAIIGNSTAAGILSGEERSCLILPGGSCEWRI